MYVCMYVCVCVCVYACVRVWVHMHECSVCICSPTFFPWVGEKGKHWSGHRTKTVTYQCHRQWQNTFRRALLSALPL